MDIPEIEKLKEELERILKGAWDTALQEILKEWERLKGLGLLTYSAASQIVRSILSFWPEAVAASSTEFINKIFNVSFAAGVVDTELKVSPDIGDLESLTWMTHQRNGFVPALKGIAEEGRQAIEEILKDAHEPGVPYDLDIMQAKVRDAVEGVSKNKAELIVRTETAKISALGRIAAWGDDPDRDWYMYHWIATPDNRVKDISLKFEREGPYDYDKIKSIWEHDHNEPQLVRNRKTGKMEFQISAFNCRCSVARSPKNREQLENEGKVSRMWT